MKLLSFLLLPLTCNAFAKIPHNVPSKIVKPAIVGSTEPLPNFDPLNFSSDETKTQFLREAELKHGRLAMLSSSIMTVSELITNEPSVHNFQSFPNMVQVGLVSSMFVSEFTSMLKGWKNPYTNSFELKEDYQPGDFGFNIIKDFHTSESIEKMNKELNNGRLAMIGVLGMICQELVTDKSIFN
ncbi:chlorophyll a-b binding domain-containing protein [Candidatus Poseidonia alphae]|nr:chlorophyll a-b binding domain-containing protein [Candidatus Poseidonia alphae]